MPCVTAPSRGEGNAVSCVPTFLWKRFVSLQLRSSISSHQEQASSSLGRAGTAVPVAWGHHVFHHWRTWLEPTPTPAVVARANPAPQNTDNGAEAPSHPWKEALGEGPVWWLCWERGVPMTGSGGAEGLEDGGGDGRFRGIRIRSCSRANPTPVSIYQLAFTRNCSCRTPSGHQLLPSLLRLTLAGGKLLAWQLRKPLYAPVNPVVQKSAVSTPP